VKDERIGYTEALPQQRKLSYDIFANKTQYKANLEQQYKTQQLPPSEPWPVLEYLCTIQAPEDLKFA